MELKTQCRERFKPAVDAINEIIKQEDNTDRPILVAIDGRCGSGKTTLGEYLKGQLDCNLFHMDDFFLRMEQRTPDRMKETGGNVDYERFYETVLIPVQKKESVCYQPFSCKEWRLLDAYEIPYKRINIIEGSYSLHPYFGKPYQQKISYLMNMILKIWNSTQRKRLYKKQRATHYHLLLQCLTVMLFSLNTPIPIVFPSLTLILEKV